MKKKSVVLIAAVTLMVLIITFFVLKTGFTKRAMAAAKEKILKIFINGKETKVKPVEQGNRKLVPLHFPIQKGEHTWEIKIKHNPKTGKVEITKVMLKRKVRTDTECHVCSGSGKCQECYPIGSGKTINEDEPCPVCDGTGKCFYCNGEGSY